MPSTKLILGRAPGDGAWSQVYTLRNSGLLTIGLSDTLSSLADRFRRTPLRWRLTVLLLVVAVVSAIFLIPEPEFSRDYFERVGYPGVFLVTLIANASIILPTPGFLAIIAAGAVLNPLLVAVIGAAGMTMGELSGYLVGRAGSTLTTGKSPQQQQRWPRWTTLSQRLVGRWGTLGIVVLAATPNPLFDLAGIAAGGIKMGGVRFLLATFAGRLIRTSLLAYASAYSVSGILDFFD